MIKKARQDKALQGTELVYGKVEELPFQDEMFAYQYSINTIYFWESLDQGFQELYRCGKPDSICVIAFYSASWLKRKRRLFPMFHCYEKETILQSMESNGFTKESLLTMGKDKGYCLIARRK